jgi:UDP-N-acetyl-D-glucosamine dehydrogenase
VKHFDDQKISVIGQGYVGLPLALAAANAGYTVIGYDSDSDKIRKLKSGLTPIEGISSEALKLAINSGKYLASDLIEDCLDSSIKIICVPTPLDDREKPDLKPLESAAANVGKILKRGNLIILESTVAPFTTRDFLLPILERESALSSSEFELAYSPEIIEHANEYWDTITTPKIVSGNK